MVLKKVIKVDNLVFEKLSKLKREFNVESPNQVIRKLLEKYEKGLPQEIEGVTPKGLPEWINDVGRVGSYYIVCTECRKHIAHLVVETEDSITYYCPFCDKAIVLRKKLSTQR